MTVPEFLAFAEPLPDATLLLREDGWILAANSATTRLLGRCVAGARLQELAADDGARIAEYLLHCSRARLPLPGTITWNSRPDPLPTRCDGGAVDPRFTAGERWIVLRCVRRQQDLQHFRLPNEQVAVLARETEVILESLSDGFIALDSEWRLRYVNRKAAELARGARERLLGAILWDELPALRTAHFENELRRAMAERTAVHFEDYVPAYEIWLEHDVYPMHNGLAVFTRDATGRRKFDEQLRQTQKLESLGILAGGVAHDFNNLLVGILGNASLALETLPPADPARVSIRNVVDAGERAAHLTRQLLAYAGKGRFLVEPVDLSELVRQIARLVQASIPKEATLRLELQEGLPAVDADVAQLQQLVMNVVINGAEALEGKAGFVRVTTGLEEVGEQRAACAAQDLRPGLYVSLEVSDNGVGMSEEVLARIFDPFFTTKFTGRGLGLAAVMGIVRGHRGGIKVHSTAGKGTTFKILFPAAKQPMPAVSAARGCIAGAEGEGRLVLVVDDEEMIRRTARSMLEHSGYRVLVAENGRQGVDLYRAHGSEISVVLLDMTMPVLGGETAFRELKAIDPDVCVLLSSGYNEAETLRRFAGGGVAGFVQKPYSAPTLLKKIGEVIAEASRCADAAG